MSALPPTDRSTETPPTGGPRLSRRMLLMGLVASTASSGCINFSTMMGKLIMGDPQISSSFRQRTGVNLGSKNNVILFSTAPVTVLDENSSLTYDVTQQLSRKMGLRKIPVVSPTQVSNVIDRRGGDANPLMLAREFKEADYIIHIKFSGYGIKEPNSPNLYRGYAAGMLLAWQATGDEDGARFVSQIFEKEFVVEHPRHPVSRDSMSINAFEKQFVDHLSSQICNTFCDFRSSEIV